MSAIRVEHYTICPLDESPLCQMSVRRNVRRRYVHKLSVRYQYFKDLAVLKGFSGIFCILWIVYTFLSHFPFLFFYK